MRLPAFLRRHLNDDFWLFLLVAVAGVYSADVFYVLQWHVADYDAIANLNIARLFFDSVTPGISQLGVWNMLIHVVLIPATLSQTFYRTGMAGFVTLLPFTFLSTIFLFRTVLILTQRRSIAYLGALAFLFNPYILFYTVAPMSEMLLIFGMLGAVYYFARWGTDGGTFDLLLFAFYVSVAAMARLEGFALFPAGFVVLLFLQLTQRAGWQKMIGALTLYSSLGSLGWFFIVMYSWFYTGNPIFFVSYTTLAETTAKSSASSTVAGSVFDNFRYALINMVSAPLVYATVACAPLAPFLAAHARKILTFCVLALLAATPAFVILTLFSHARPLQAPELGSAFNVRYLLQFTPLCVVSCACFAGGLANAASSVSGRLVRLLKKAAMRLFCLFMLGSIAFQLYDVIAVRNFNGVTHFVYKESQREDIIDNFYQYYDYGYILTAHYNSVAFMYRSQLPLDRFIYEANYRFFQQAAREPWLFVRWIAKNQRVNAYTNLIDTEDQKFQYYFEQVTTIDLGEGKLRVYRLREDRVRAAAALLGIDERAIPSLRHEAVPWDPLTVYETLKLSRIHAP